MKESKYQVGDLVSCYYKTIPPTPQWDPFSEGRPAIILNIKNYTTIGASKAAQFHYTVAVSSWQGTIDIKIVSEENLLPFAALPELSEEIDELVMKYYKENPLASD